MNAREALTKVYVYSKELTMGELMDCVNVIFSSLDRLESAEKELAEIKGRAEEKRAEYADRNKKLLDKTDHIMGYTQHIDSTHIGKEIPLIDFIIKGEGKC